jgi:ParB family transcriptional regulator, chromosome partitioning protein
VSETTEDTQAIPRARRRKFSVDALFTDTSKRAAGVADLVDAKLIPHERIEPDPDQPRRDFDEQALEELAASIRSEGILQPIAVRYDDARDCYVILHGERRWRAAALAGLETLPAVVRDVPEDRRLLQQLIENIVREDLNALDRAAALRQLKARMNDAPWEKVAEAVGIRRSRLFQLIGTEKLDESLKDALRRGAISEKQSRAVQGMPPEIQQRVGAALAEGKLDSRRFEEVINSARDNSPLTLIPRPAPDDNTTLTTTHRKTRALLRALDELDGVSARGTANLNPTTIEQLLDDLATLQQRIDEVAARLG